MNNVNEFCFVCINDDNEKKIIYSIIEISLSEEKKNYYRYK